MKKRLLENIDSYNILSEAKPQTITPTSNESMSDSSGETPLKSQPKVEEKSEKVEHQHSKV